MAAFDEVETLVQSRRLADAICKELEQTLTRPIDFSHAPTLPAAPAIEPEELLPPPPSLPPSNIYETSWSTTMPVAAAPALLKRPPAPTTLKRRKKRKMRSHLHWAVLAMCVAIAVGLWRDPHARANAKRGFFAEKQRVVQIVKTTKTRATARIVSARII